MTLAIRDAGTIDRPMATDLVKVAKAAKLAFKT
jgi:hypothetical protein